MRSVDDTDHASSDGCELLVFLENAQVVWPKGLTVVLSTDTSGANTRLVDAFGDGVDNRLKCIFAMRFGIGTRAAAVETQGFRPRALFSPHCGC